MILFKALDNVGDTSRPALALILPIALVFSLFLAGCLLGPYTKVPESGIPVIFTYRGNHRSVCISGDFNNWSRSQCLTQQGEGLWTIRIFLEPGRYHYGFLLDGDRWVPDPNGLLDEDDGFGNRNSVLNLE
jgi:hypothetical protein